MSTATFQEAAASYFGLAETNLRKIEVFSDGDLVVAFEITLTSGDVLAITDRMRSMGEQPAPAEPPSAQLVELSREQMREAYNALGPAERSQYGSFARYVAEHGGTDPYTTVAKIELPPHVYLTPAETTAQQRVMAIGRDEKGNYAIDVGDLTAAQRVDHMDDVGPGGDVLRAAWCAAVEQTTQAEINGNRKPGDPAPLGLVLGYADLPWPGQLAGAPADELRAGYVAQTVAAMERLSGADGKPTSNADDFGGVPG